MGKISTTMLTPGFAEQLLTDVLEFWMINGCPVPCFYAPHLLCTYWSGCKSSMQQAFRPAGVQVQPDNQSKPRQTPAAGALCHSGSKLTLREKKTKKLSSALLPSSPLNQGAFTACARVSELQVFTQTAEVKVDPDKPLEGARLAVLQVALCRKTPRVSHIITFIYVLHLYLSCNHVNLTCMELETVLEIQRII